MRNMKTLIHVAIVIGVLVLCSARAEACSCSEPSQREKFRKADVVFVGEIVEFHYLKDFPKDSDFVQSVNFTVRRQWKGSKQKQINVLLTFDLPGMCNDMPLAVGRRYLMYAYREKEGLVSGTDCGPNIIESEAGADIRNLNSFWFRLWARLWIFN
jgi:hypothetical protein